jgi:hypothetical protein
MHPVASDKGMARVGSRIFYTIVTLDLCTATAGGLSFRSRFLMRFFCRASVKLLKPGRIRIDYLDHSHLDRTGLTRHRVRPSEPSAFVRSIRFRVDDEFL